jgi:hypothetical protein
VLRQATPITLERSELIELSHRERKRKGAAAFRFVTTQDLRELLRAARQQIEAERYESLDSLVIVRRPQQHSKAMLPEEDNGRATQTG